MFDSLSDKLEQTVKRLRGHGKITERNIEDAVREVRLALLEADVQFEVARDFTERVRGQSLGAEVLASLTPEQHFIKIVRAELTDAHGRPRRRARPRRRTPPVVIMLVGLQGGGKTTTIAKLARYLKTQRGRSPYLVPADVYRPAAIEQLDDARRAGRRARCIRRRPAPIRSTICRAARDAATNRALRRGADRHRRPPAHRRRADGRARAHPRRGRSRTRSCWWSTR